MEPLSFKLVERLILAHNQAGMAAMQLSEAASVVHDFSHLIVESDCLHLLLRFVLQQFASVKLDFSDSI